MGRRPFRPICPGSEKRAWPRQGSLGPRPSPGLGLSRAIFGFKGKAQGPRARHSGPVQFVFGPLRKRNIELIAVIPNMLFFAAASPTADQQIPAARFCHMATDLSKTFIVPSVFADFCRLNIDIKTNGNREHARAG